MEASFTNIEVVARALLLLVGGYVVGNFAGFFAKLFIKNVIGLDRWIEKKKLRKSLKTQPSTLISLIIKWYAYLAFTLSAAQLFGENPFLMIIQNIFNYYPKLVGAIFLYILGVLIAETARKILSAQDIIAEILYLGILGIFILSAVQTLGFNIQPILLVLSLFLGSFLITLGIAFGIGLGLALKDILEPHLKKLEKRWFGE